MAADKPKILPHARDKNSCVPRRKEGRKEQDLAVQPAYKEMVEFWDRITLYNVLGPV